MKITAKSWVVLPPMIALYSASKYMCKMHYMFKH